MSKVFNTIGDEFWRNEKGEYHREDGPAIIYTNGTKCWYINNKLHREDGPAVEDSDGYKEWWINGKCHREDGPAVEFTNGSKHWYKHGKYHREDGPAIESSNGNKYWIINGNLHREDGPAIEEINGAKYWIIKGKQYSEEEFNKKVSEMNNKNPEINKYGNKIWKNEKGEFHRLDGPAIEYANGDKEWWLNGKLHRLDGPAIKFVNGDKYWYINGKLHREDGPAKEYYNGDKYWFIEGNRYSKEEYNKLIGNKSFTKEKVISILEKSAYRSAGKQITKAFNLSIIKILESKNINSPEVILKFLDTEIGEAMVSIIIGSLLSYIPHIKNDNRVNKLIEEFQVEGIAKISDTVLDEIISYTTPIIGNILSNILKSRIEENQEEFTLVNNLVSFGNK